MSGAMRTVGASPSTAAAAAVVLLGGGGGLLSGLFGGGGLAGILQLDHARHYGENDHQGHYDLGAVMDKKFLDFRVVRICFVSHNMHPF